MLKSCFALVRLRNSLFLAVFIVLLSFSSMVQAAKIIELSIKGPIGPATADYIIRGIDAAQNAQLILIIMDTPGGLDSSTRLIIQKFLSSAVPVVTYVSPNGARAASAGTYLIYASTLAAMAPGTQLGAASPVSLSAGFEEEKGKGKSTMDKKVTNDAVATIRTLAQLRGRNVEFAQNAVLNAATLTSSEALKAGVINYIAKDRGDLFAQLNGITVEQNGKKITLDTLNPEIHPINPDWRTRFLSIITDPTVAYLLVLLGIYGIFFELMNPGHVLPGVVGVVAMIIALYALQLLPVNYAGLGLIIAGIIFIIAEGVTPSYGALGVGGTIAFLIGSVMLMDTDFATYQIAWPVIAGMAFTNILVFIVLFGMLMKSRKQKVRHGLDVLVGARGRSLGAIDLQGQAVIRGEIWSVQSQKPIAADKPIWVVATSGLTLEVEEDNRTE
ncbi:MAG: nodulation protein NfeD [Legionella sp.]|nr:MAG: nodulation protein NfeD [Legionella sp.]